jgi:hypothetical protein
LKILRRSDYWFAYFPNNLVKDQCPDCRFCAIRLSPAAGVEAEVEARRTAVVDRYLLLVEGPFAYLKGRDGEQHITATRRGGRWWITPNTSAYPRRGTSPGS